MGASVDSDELDELVRRCAAADRAALQTLYARTAPLLLGNLTRILGSRTAAEDALQDTFLRIWQQAAQFESVKGRALSWMVAIARNRAIDMQRSRRPTVLLEAAELAGAEQMRIDGPADRSEFTAAREALQRCLATLAPTQQQCLALAYQQGLTHESIALAIGQPLGSVKSWVRRGLQRLKACMES